MITNEALIQLLTDYETKLGELSAKYPKDGALMELYFDVKSTKKALSLNLIGGQAAPMGAPAAPAPAQKSKKVKDEPSEPAKPAEPFSQRYIDNRWQSYFDEPYIKVYERYNPKCSNPFYATLTRTGERADVTFGMNVAQLWFETGLPENYILPSSYELQARRGKNGAEYLQVYIKSVEVIGTEEEALGEPKQPKKPKKLTVPESEQTPTPPKRKR